MVALLHSGLNPGHLVAVSGRARSLSRAPWEGKSLHKFWGKHDFQLSSFLSWLSCKSQQTYRARPCPVNLTYSSLGDLSWSLEGQYRYEPCASITDD